MQSELYEYTHNLIHKKYLNLYLITMNLNIHHSLYQKTLKVSPVYSPLRISQLLTRRVVSVCLTISGVSSLTQGSQFNQVQEDLSKDYLSETFYLPFVSCYAVYVLK